LWRGARACWMLTVKHSGVLGKVGNVVNVGKLSKVGNVAKLANLINLTNLGKWNAATSFFNLR
jgi:hypothetical protein